MLSVPSGEASAWQEWGCPLQFLFSTSMSGGKWNFGSRATRLYDNAIIGPRRPISIRSTESNSCSGIEGTWLFKNSSKRFGRDDDWRCFIMRLKCELVAATASANSESLISLE